MSNTPIQDAVRAYALSQAGAAYVMGATAAMCTPGMRRSLAAGRSSDYAEAIISSCPALSGRNSCDGCRYAGRLAFDCAQLSRYAAKAGGIELPSGSNSQWGKADWAVRGEIAAMPMDVVCFVFHYKPETGKMSHVGVYLGDGTVADARGHAYGVLHTQVTSYPWTHFAIPAAIAEEAGMNLTGRPDGEQTFRRTLRRGSKGEDVRYLQQLLNAAGASGRIAVDGSFGAETLAAVKAFQTEHGLASDGVAGPLTWAALEKTSADNSRAEEPLPEISALVADINRAMEAMKSAVDALAAAMTGGAAEQSPA